MSRRDIGPLLQVAVIIALIVLGFWISASTDIKATGINGHTYVCDWGSKGTGYNCTDLDTGEHENIVWPLGWFWYVTPAP